jgi:prephenate dehydrogenase (NADP+)
MVARTVHGQGAFEAELIAQIIIHHRGPESKVRMVEDVFRSFKSRYVYLSYEEHDSVTANTQAVTHAAFLR